ncbi:MAG: carbohydrate kinase family protein [Tissierellia bacterium]|nr:carbohydrate kinase family protein [Tissierellia bacterium]
MVKEKKMKVLAIGALAMDVSIRVDELPKEDGFSLILEEVIVPGGSGANFSVALQALGSKVYQTGKIGSDSFGERFRESIVQADIDDRYLITKPNGTTLHTYVFVAGNGSHSILFNLGDSVNELTTEELPTDVLDGIDVFYTDMFSPIASIQLARRAKEKGIKVVYNMQCSHSTMASFGTTGDMIDELISYTDLLICGKTTYSELFNEGSHAENIAIFYREKYNTHNLHDGIIFTMGEKGSIWFDGSQIYYQPKYDVATVDTTGAGDCYNAGVVYEYYQQGKEKEAALKFGSAIAAMKCTQPGPRVQCTPEEVEQFMHSIRMEG